MSSSKFEILQIEFPDTAQKFLVPRNLFPDNLLRELREKSLQHSRILHRTWLAGRQNRKFPCKIPREVAWRRVRSALRRQGGSPVRTAIYRCVATSIKRNLVVGDPQRPLLGLRETGQGDDRQLSKAHHPGGLKPTVTRDNMAFGIRENRVGKAECFDGCADLIDLALGMGACI